MEKVITPEQVAIWMDNNLESKDNPGKYTFKLMQYSSAYTSYRFWTRIQYILTIPLILATLVFLILVASLLLSEVDLSSTGVFWKFSLSLVISLFGGVFFSKQVEFAGNNAYSKYLELQDLKNEIQSTVLYRGTVMR